MISGMKGTVSIPMKISAGASGSVCDLSVSSECFAVTTTLLRSEAYCAGRVALPAGGNPGRLPQDHPLHRENRVEECALRCRAQQSHFPGRYGDTALVIKEPHGSQFCICASGDCTSLLQDSDQASYSMSFSGTCVAPTIIGCDDPDAATCTITCDDGDTDVGLCKGAGTTLQCADDRDCDVVCSEPWACADATLNCPDNAYADTPHACTVRCTGDAAHACSGLTIHAEYAQSLDFVCDARGDRCGHNAQVRYPS